MADTDGTSGTPEHRRRRGLILGIVIAVVVVVVVAFVVWAVGHGRQPQQTTGSTATSLAMPRSSVSPPSTPVPSATSTPLPTGAATPKAVTGSSASPAPLASPAAVVPGVTVSIRQLSSVTGKANGVGEIDGPAIRFEVVFANTSAKPVDLGTVVVSVTSGTARTPADELASARTPLPAKLAASSTATGVYTFTLAKSERRDVQISVDYRAGIPVVVFSGNAPTS